MPVANRTRWKTGVYCITNTVNGKVYIGSAAGRGGIAGRWRQHKHAMIHGLYCSKHSHLQRAWDKYGISAFQFSVLLLCPPEWCIANEQMFIDQFKATDRKYGYNTNPIAGSRLGTKMPAEAVEKTAAALRGRKLSEEHKAKVSASLKGLKRTPEEIEKSAAARRGLKKTPEHIEKIAASHRGKKQTSEHIDKCAAIRRGKKHSAERREKEVAILRKRNQSTEHREKVAMYHHKKRLERMML